MAASSAISTSFCFSKASVHKKFSWRSSMKPIVAASASPYKDSSSMGLSSDNEGLQWKPREKNSHTSSNKEGLQLKPEEKNSHTSSNASHSPVEVKCANPPVMPAVITPEGALDLNTVLFRNRIIFIGQPIDSDVAQRVISQLVTLATIDENADIVIYLNCPGGSLSSVFAVYDCMSWIKPKVGTVGFGMIASEAALILAGGEKGMRYVMPNTRIMIHQPYVGTGGHVDKVRIQADEAAKFRNKTDKMFAAFTGQPFETVQMYTDRDYYFSGPEAMDFGLIDGLMETEI